MDVSFKTNILNHFKQKVMESLHSIQQAIDSTEEALREETKSSAGDKYETSREMLQADLNRLEQQKDQLSQNLGFFKTTNENQTIQNGSLVQLEINQQTLWLFLGPAIGNITLDNIEIRSVSVQAPLGAALLGKHVNDYFHWNQKSIRILNCY